jgi:hypothetical protein
MKRLITTNQFKKIIPLLSLLLFTLNAYAVEFKVGRTTVQFPDDNWSEVAYSDKGADYSGDISGTVKSETKAYIKKSDANVVEAIVLVRSSLGGVSTALRFTHSVQCDSNENSYAYGNTGFNRDSAECVRVFPAYSAEGVISTVAPNILNTINRQNLKLPDSFWTAFSYGATSNASFLEVTAFISPEYAGRNGAFDAKLPPGVQQENALWGRELFKAVRSSILSLFGKFTFPVLDNKSTKIGLNSK